MGLLPLNYRRPEYVDKEEFIRSANSAAFDETSDASLKSGRSGASSGIPEALTFDKIINGGTCPPCTLRDFMNYLIYIEHSAENLQFFLWYHDYIRRFYEAPISEIALAPEWTRTMEEDTIAKIQKDAASKMNKDSPLAREIFKGTDFNKAPGIHAENKDPFSTPPGSSAGDRASFVGSQATTYVSQGGDAFSAAGVKRPCKARLSRCLVSQPIAYSSQSLSSPSDQRLIASSALTLSMGRSDS
ncbi:hypothetical protein NUW58_g9000 [Xylaria curta]|uniref:Uncharacterized protein n=1 Tax=Xylaria curta TaxID=42375 RepID=A0ACC1N2Q3_9PEZI|nr:hypothetical protein NUW58_g9000 [Xylaria curta]